MAGIGFNTGLKALLGSQVALDTVGHNIANAGIKGYSQQNVMFNTSSPLNVRGLLIGSGVEAASIQRSFDNVLQTHIYSRLGSGNGFEARANAYGEVESLFSEPNGFGLGSSMDDFFASISELAGAPDDTVLRTSMTQGAVNLTSTFNQLASALNTFGDDLAKKVSGEALQVNDLAGQIAVLNSQIAETEASGIPANDLRDSRGVIIEELSELVNIQVTENSTGSVNVTVGGATLVGSKGSYAMSLVSNNGGKPQVQIKGVVGAIDVTGGSLGAHMEMSTTDVPSINSEIDDLAKEIIFQVNKIHSTAVPGTGPYNLLVADNSIGDVDGDGKFTDELLNNGSLPFDVTTGELYVTITEEATGEITKHKIDINAKKTTAGEFAEALSDLPHISAEFGNLGNLRIISDAGYGYDFSPTLDSNPDNIGAFGGGKASLGTEGGEPFMLGDGQTLDLSVDVAGVPTLVSINLDLADFEDITAATAEELAAVVNADPSAQAVGLTASSVNGHFFVQTAGEGSTEAFQVVGGTALAGLGWSGQAGATFTGSDTSVKPIVSGSYSGDVNDVYEFVPTGDGVIGTTPGLGIEVYDQDGELVVTLDVGEGYVPGTELTVADGMSVAFDLGDLSKSGGDYFHLDVVADPDTSNVLVALGVAGMFTGSGALDISLREDIELDPDLLATAFGNAESDSSALLAMFDQKDGTHASLGGESFDEFYSQFIGGIGFEASTAQTAYSANTALLGSLQLQREQVSGVNVDEELIDLMRYEQSYQAAIQYISSVDKLNEAILSLV